jgi:prophage DNA circulation protein
MMPAREVVGVAEPALPVAVATAHLAACASAFAGAELPVSDMAEAADDIVASQRDIAAGLNRLAGRLERGPLTKDRAALVEILRAAAVASSCAAEALAAGGQLFESVADETHF